MIDIDGLPLLSDITDVLNLVKYQVKEQQNRDILNKIKVSGDNVMICCPKHNFGQERKPSCGIRLVDGRQSKAGQVHCFACGYTDSFTGFIGTCFGMESNSEWGKQWLLQNFITGTIENRPRIKCEFKDRNIEPKKIEYVTEEELAKYRFYHPYMWQRKLTPEVVEKYDVGYQKDFVYSDGWQPTDVLTFPVRDINGNCLFVSRRSITGKTFFLPQNLEKPVYGIYELPEDCKEVIICESVFNALTCVVYGRPAVALFGTGSPYQYEQLNKLPVRRYILALDPDSAGYRGTYKLKKAIQGKLVTKLLIPKGKDINDLSYTEFCGLPEIFA